MQKTACFATLVLLFGCSIALAQQPRPEAFDVVSVKAVHPDTSTVLQTDKGLVRPAYKPFRFNPGRVTCTLPLITIIAQAYSLKLWQVSGAPWLYDGAYELNATMPVETTQDHAKAMLRAMLAERFGLKTHNETRDVPVYELGIVKDKLRLIESAETDAYSFVSNSADFTGTKLTTQHFADWLAQRMDRPVIDRTALAGVYNIRLKWTPEYSDSSGVKAIMDLGLVRTLKSDLGLTITAAKSPNKYW